ncbi:hypothetical protein V8E55_009552 [Tylopilus felleus]
MSNRIIRVPRSKAGKESALYPAFVRAANAALLCLQRLDKTDGLRDLFEKLVFHVNDLEMKQSHQGELFTRKPDVILVSNTDIQVGCNSKNDHDMFEVAAKKPTKISNGQVKCGTAAKKENGQARNRTPVPTVVWRALDPDPSPSGRELKPAALTPTKSILLPKLQYFPRFLVLLLAMQRFQNHHWGLNPDVDPNFDELPEPGSNPPAFTAVHIDDPVQVDITLELSSVN